MRKLDFGKQDWQAYPYSCMLLRDLFNQEAGETESDVWETYDPKEWAEYIFPEFIDNASTILGRLEYACKTLVYMDTHFYSFGIEPTGEDKELCFEALEQEHQCLQELGTLELISPMEKEAVEYGWTWDDYTASHTPEYDLTVWDK